MHRLHINTTPFKELEHSWIWYLCRSWNQFPVILRDDYILMYFTNIQWTPNKDQALWGRAVGKGIGEEVSLSDPLSPSPAAITSLSLACPSREVPFHTQRSTLILCTTRGTVCMLWS